MASTILRTSSGEMRRKSFFTGLRLKRHDPGKYFASVKRHPKTTSAAQRGRTDNFSRPDFPFLNRVWVYTTFKSIFGISINI